MFEWLSESVWGFPIIAAVHVAGLAWFGWTVLVSDGEVTAWKRAGLAFMLVSGALLFGMHPGRYWASSAFRVKLVLLAVLLSGLRLPRAASFVLWTGVILAARFTAYF